MLVLVWLVTPHATLSCHQTSELPYEITGSLCTEKPGERMEEKRSEVKIYDIPTSGVPPGCSEGDR